MPKLVKKSVVTEATNWALKQFIDKLYIFQNLFRTSKYRFLEKSRLVRIFLKLKSNCTDL